MFAASIQYPRRQAPQMSCVTSCSARKKKKKKKKQKNEMLPPTSDCLLQHLKRANYQAFVWRNALDAMQDLESPEGHGWVRDSELLVPLMMTKAPAPESLLELTTCKCKTSACLRNCSCNNTGLHRRLLLHGRR